MNQKTEKRERTIKIRLTNDEHLAIVERSDRARLAEWIRELALGQRKRRPVPKADPALLRQLAAIGSNVNQIARHCNNRQKPIDAIEISAALIAISRELEGLRLAGQNQQ